MRANLSSDSGFLKVVDDTTGAIVATSIHSYNPEPPKAYPGLSKEGRAGEDDQEYAQHLRVERNALLSRVFAQLQGPVTGMSFECHGTAWYWMLTMVV